MKSYTNPQPQAVERINKIQEKQVKKDKPHTKRDYITSKNTNKEIFKNESEEQAWKDALKKTNPLP